MSFDTNDFEIKFGAEYDLIYSIDTFDRIPKDRIAELILNIYNAVNDGGFVFAIIGLGHDDDRGFDLDQAKQILQPRDWWVNQFKEAGFSNDEISSCTAAVREASNNFCSSEGPVFPKLIFWKFIYSSSTLSTNPKCSYFSLRNIVKVIMDYA